MIELHYHIGADVALDAHHRFGSEKSTRSVDVALELDSFLTDFSERREGENLKSTGIGENRTIPPHELVQATHLADELVTWPQMEVIGVRQDHRRAHRREIVGVEGLYGRKSSDRHECRRWNVAVRSGIAAGSGRAGRCFQRKLETQVSTDLGGAGKATAINDDGRDEKLDGTDDFGEMIGLGLLRCRVCVVILQVSRMDDQNDPLTHEIIAAAIAVSKYWGNGALENVYKKSLAHELKKRGLDVAIEVPIPGIYDSIQFDVAFRADLIVERAVVVESKAISATLPVRRAQLLTYMRLSAIPKGLLINFHSHPFTKGITRLSQ